MKISNALFLLFAAAPVLAASDPRLAATGSRGEAVTRVRTWPGVVSTIVFPAGEEVLHFATGFSSAWEIASRGGALFLKPRERHGDTNLVVITTRGPYLFDLRSAASAARATYLLRVGAAKEAAAIDREEKTRRLLAASSAPDASRSRVNMHYTMNFGPDPSCPLIAPTRALDDGTFTLLAFTANSEIPAIYEVTSDGEQLVNSHVEGGSVILHGVFGELRLRAGNLVVGVYNEGHGALGPDYERESGTRQKGLRRSVKQGDGK